MQVITPLNHQLSYGPLTVDVEEAGWKLFIFCHQRVCAHQLSRRRLHACFQHEVVTLNDKTIPMSKAIAMEAYRVQVGDVVEVKYSWRTVIEDSYEYSLFHQLLLPADSNSSEEVASSSGATSSTPVVKETTSTSQQRAQVLHQGDKYAVVDKPSGIECYPTSKFLYALRLLLWGGKHYDSQCTLFEVERGIHSVLVICIDEDVRQAMLNSFLQPPQPVAENVGLTSLTVTYHCLACHYTTVPSSSYPLADFFNFFRICDIEELRTVSCRGKDTLSLLRISLTTLATTTKITAIRLSEDMKSIKRFCKHNNIVIVGQDDVLVKGKGIFSCFTSVILPSNPVDGCGETAARYDIPVNEKLFNLMEREQTLYDKYMLQCQKKMAALNVEEESLTAAGAARIPMEYRVGKATFCGQVFQVSPAVMIPRKCSETLVHTAVDYVSTLLSPSKHVVRVLDLGTGSGCLLLSTIQQLQLQQKLVGYKVEVIGRGIDISEAALDIARQNQVQLGVESGSCSFQLGDFADVSSYQLPRVGGGGTEGEDSLSGTNSWDVILCNPPYSAQKDYHRLSHSVKQHEPATALFADEYHALKAYCSIQHTLQTMSLDNINPLPFAHNVTRLILEIGHGQEKDVREIFQETACWQYVETRFDHKGLQRCLVYVFVNK